MKIKIFSQGSIGQLEKEVNDFLVSHGNNITRVETDLKVTQLTDYYEDGRFCNQWTEYTVILTYNELI